MENIDFKNRVERILSEDPRYPYAAYEFVNEAVTFTIERDAARREDGSRRHVSARELLDGMTDYAREQFGPMAWEVLSCWRLRDPVDVGRVVFNMVDHRLLSRSENDDAADFNLDYDLAERLQAPFRGMDDTRRDLQIPIIV